MARGLLPPRHRPEGALTRLDAPATHRNREAILAELRRLLPARGLVLEVASGTGQHCAFFAEALPALTFQPSEPRAEGRASVAAWCDGLPNVLPPLDLDAERPPWPLAGADAALCVNMIHIAPRRAAEGLFAGAAAVLAEGAPLILYGHFKRHGAHTSPSNESFDEGLRAENGDWGVRDLDGEVAPLAARCGFGAPEVTAMPANNLLVAFRRVAARPEAGTA
jgi:SAM-dependent methyltransferase